MKTLIDRRKALLGLTTAVLAACGGGDYAETPRAAAPPPPPPPNTSTVSAAVAVKWSNLATNAMLADTAAQPPGLSPMEQSRILAMAFLAGHDALNNIVRVYRPFGYDDGLYPQAQPTYTYELAVCKVLMSLLPLHAREFDRVLQASLALGKIAPYGDEFELGEACAARVIALRAGDGAANAQGPYTPGMAPGDYQVTPPVNVATFVNWGKVRPFAMTTGDQFRAPPPHDLTSAAYAADFNEVKSLGAAVGASRTPDQSEIAKFWLESTPLSWQRIAARSYEFLASYGGPPGGDPGLSLWAVARTFALLQMAQADAYIASLESKYHYNFWRPITAIGAAATDNNPATMPDPAWEPFDPVTPPVPEYPSAHAAAGMAGAAIFSGMAQTEPLLYRSSTGSTERSFEDFPATTLVIAHEIGLSRIYVGYHFRHAVEAGWQQGGEVGAWVLDHALQNV